MKKINIYFLLIVVIFTLSGCNNKSENEEKDLKVSDIQSEEIETESTTKEEFDIVENNTYSTKFGEYNGIDYPVYTFEYPDNWSVTSEKCDVSQEFVTLTNERGVEITFSHWNAPESETFQYGGVGLTNVEINEVADSKFVPSFVYGKDYSDLGDFMVAKITKTSFEDGITGEATPCDGYFFAVLPKSEIGKTYYKTAIEAVFSFWQGNHISFVCVSPDFNYTEEEEKEIIAIMSSFRSNTIDVTENIKINNTYKTKYQDICLATYPYFEFDYPDNWTITYEKCEDFEEFVTLSNERGVEIKFSHMNAALQTNNASIREIEVIKVYESNYISGRVQGTDHSHLGAFVVARFKQTDDSIVYGVIPASYISSEGTIVGDYGSAYSFPYSGNISFVCDTKGIQLTEQEKREVMVILGSFREVGYD